jgi:hypothetical protein
MDITLSQFLGEEGLQTIFKSFLESVTAHNFVFVLISSVQFYKFSHLQQNILGGTLKQGRV